MYRRVYDFDVLAVFLHGFGGERKFAYSVEIRLVHTLAYDGDMRCDFDVVKPFYIVRSQDHVFFFNAEIRGFIYKFHHFIRRFGRHLRSVLAVDFISVVDFGVVRCGDHNARNRSQVAYCKRAHRHGVHGVKEVGVYAVFGKHFCHFDRKFA